MKTIGRKFLALLVGKKEETVKTHFRRRKISKDDPEQLRDYLKKEL